MYMNTDDYIAQAEKPEESTKAEEPAVMPYGTAAHMVHVPVNTHGRDIDWVALQAFLEANAQAFVARSTEEEQPKPQKKLKFRHILSDEELEKELEGLPSWDEVEHPDLSFLTKEDYNYAIRKMARKPMNGIEKWL